LYAFIYAVHRSVRSPIRLLFLLVEHLGCVDRIS
jgi:hypothetical protein